MLARYKNIPMNKFDGIHMYGPSGMKAYTASVLNFLSEAKLVLSSTPRYYDQYDYQSCDQARYQNRTKNVPRTQSKERRTPGADSYHDNVSGYHYSMPTQNRYAKLGDFFPKNY